MTKHFFKDILLILISNIFADTSIILTFYLMSIVIISMSEDIVLCCAVLFYIVLILIGRFAILPVFYDYVLKKSQSSLSKKIIHKLKKSNFVKIVTVIILTLFSETLNLLLYDVKITTWNIIFIDALMSLFIGILGSYIFLFLYWYISDKFNENHLVNKLLNIMINKYTCIFSVIAIVLGYIVIIIMVFTSNFDKI